MIFLPGKCCASNTQEQGDASEWTDDKNKRNVDERIAIVWLHEFFFGISLFDFEGEFANLAICGSRQCEPMLQTAPMKQSHCARASAWRNERFASLFSEIEFRNEFAAELHQKMAIQTDASPTILSNIKIGLKNRKTSSLDSNVDLMNTAFFEPDIDPEAGAEMRRAYSEKREPDAWEESIIELKKKYPFLMCFVIPAIIQLLLLSLIIVFLTKTGASDAIDKLAANLYYFIFCFMFSI